MNNLSSSCAFCGKTVGPELLNCPYRPDKGCPFQCSESSPVSNGSAGCMVGVLLFVVVWLALATLGFGSMLIESQSLVSSMLSAVSLGCFWAFGLFALGFALFGLFGKNVALYNPETGAMARHATIFGRPFGGGVSPGWEALPSELTRLSLSQPLRFPASWSAWMCMTDANNAGGVASYICEATLVALVAQNVLNLKTATTRDTLLGVINRQTRRYMLTPVPDRAPPDVEGTLEQKLLAVFAQPPPTLQNEAWIPDAPVEVRQLVAAIYDRDQVHPEKWLIDLVENDIVVGGLGRKEKSEGVTGWLKRNLVLQPEAQNRLEIEYQQIREMHNQLTLSQPEFIERLQYDINKAFKDRTDSSD